RFVVESAREHDRLRQAVDESAGHHNGRMPGQIGHQKARASWSGRHEHIPVRHEFVHLAYQQSPGTLRAQVLDSRNEASGPEGVRPVAWTLARELVDRAAACYVVD